MASITKQFHEYLAPLLPGTWDVHPLEVNLDALERPAVLISYVRSSVVRQGPAALGKQYEIQLTYVSPVTHDLSVVDEDLWDAEQTVEAALQQLPFVELTESARGTYGEDNFAHVFSLQIGVPYTPNPEPDAEPDATPEEE